ncbi:MAG: hypothetical protein ABW318_11715 [Vicinamibacterales bacterium]
MLQDSPLYAYIPAADVARARRFYEGTLGLLPKQTVAGGVVYAFPNGTACFLYPTDNAGTSRASQAFWQVDDVDLEIEELTCRGVRFEEYDMPGERTRNGALVGAGAKAAWFKDTEGNILAIVESVAKEDRIDAPARKSLPSGAGWDGRVGAGSMRASALRSAAIGAIALGALAVGAMAFGAVVIGRFVVGRARIQRLGIAELDVGRLHVGELSRLPSQSNR